MITVTKFEGFRSWRLQSLTFGVQLILYQILNDCRRNPSGSWPKLAYELINRQDLIEQTKLRSSRHLFSDDQPKVSLTNRYDSLLLFGVNDSYCRIGLI